jgi:hypothetical protein|tara:strand:+ start:228 stop:527 length:300 start_codon:yes stop_codon:yes gene_type:complete
MSDIEMFHVGENDKGEELYNLRYVKGGKNLPTPSMTKAEALAKINGTEVVAETKTEVGKNYHDMTKKELELFMREQGIELDRRKSKDDLLDEVDKFFEV